MSCCLRLSNEVVKSTIERERNRWNDNLATFWLKLRVEIFFECADLFYFRPSVYFCTVNHFISDLRISMQFPLTSVNNKAVKIANHDHSPTLYISSV